MGKAMTEREIEGVLREVVQTKRSPFTESMAGS